jgi:hypothetical protein
VERAWTRGVVGVAAAPAQEAQIFDARNPFADEDRHGVLPAATSLGRVPASSTAPAAPKSTEPDSPRGASTA